MRYIERWHGVGSRLCNPSTLVLIGVNVGVYYLLLHWISANIQPDKLFKYFGAIPEQAILGSLSLNLVALSLYGIRMGLLIGRDFYTGFCIINIGYALNTLTPLRLGEGVKIYLGHRFYKIPVLAIFSASIVEKLFDLIKLLMLALVVAVFATGQVIQSSMLIYGACVVAIGIVTFITFRLYGVDVVKVLPKRGRLRKYYIELHKHARKYPLLLILCVSLAIWTINVSLVYLTFNTYLMGVSIGIFDAIVLLLIISFSIAIPSAPAGIGLFEAGIVAYLTQKFGIGNEEALAAAATFHLVITLPQLLITCGLLWSRFKKFLFGAIA